MSEESKTPTYDALPEQVRAIIDRGIEEYARVNMCSVESARELIAKGVRTTKHKPSGGTGH